MSTKAGKEHVERKLSDITIEPSKSDIEEARRIAARQEIAEINQVLRSGAARLPLRYASSNPKEVLAALTKRRDELRKRVPEQPKKPGWDTAIHTGLHQPRAARARRALNLVMSAERQFAPLDLDVLRTLIQQQQARNCPALTIGQIGASDFRIYSWKNTSEDGSNGSYAFWPLSLGPSTNDTYSGDWTDETGAYFWIWLHVEGGFFWDHLDSISAGGVLQFTIPAPACDSELAWGTWARIRMATEWEHDADHARLSTEWVVRQDATGGGYPTSLTASYQWISEGLYHGTGGATVRQKSTPLDGSFIVRAGDSPRIYLGCVPFAQAENGDASTVGHGLGDYFEFEYGVTYFMVPQQP